MEIALDMNPGSFIILDDGIALSWNTSSITPTVLALTIERNVVRPEIGTASREPAPRCKNHQREMVPRSDEGTSADTSIQFALFPVDSITGKRSFDAWVAMSANYLLLPTSATKISKAD